MNNINITVVKKRKNNIGSRKLTKEIKKEVKMVKEVVQVHKHKNMHKNKNMQKTKDIKKKQLVTHSNNKTQLHLTHKFATDNNYNNNSKHVPKVLKNVFHEHKFVLADGSNLFNLYELAVSLKDMDEAVFAHHVNESKNDFASWTREVMHENDLAEKLESTSNKQEAEAVVLRHLVNDLAQGSVAHDYMNVNSFFNLIK